MKTREEILQMVENEDVEFIRLQFTDMFGTLKNVAVTATQLQYMKDNRYLIDGSCMYGELRTGEEDMYLCPDLDTFVILPWRPQQGKRPKRKDIRFRLIRNVNLSCSTRMKTACRQP